MSCVQRTCARRGKTSAYSPFSAFFHSSPTIPLSRGRRAAVRYAALIYPYFPARCPVMNREAGMLAQRAYAPLSAGWLVRRFGYCSWRDQYRRIHSGAPAFLFCKKSYFACHRGSK